MKASVFIATSLDGYISRDNDSLDWLDDANSLVPKGEDCGYLSFMSTIDLLVMGRNTYEKVLSFGEWPYDKKVIVLSSNNISIANELKDKIEHSDKSPLELYKYLSTNGYRHIYVDGAITIQRFLNDGLIDDITITVIPVLIGSGKSLFGDMQGDIKLSLEYSKDYDFGFVQSKYSVIKDM